MFFLDAIQYAAMAIYFNLGRGRIFAENSPTL